MMHLFDEDSATPSHSSSKDSAPQPAREHADGIAAPASTSSLLHLQRTVGNAGVVQLLQDGDGAEHDDPHGLNGLLGSGGSPLDAGTKVQMESAIGADFSDVRVHTGGDADASAKSLGAHAYTAGNDIVFAEGRYDPGSESGQKTLAHELTHVVQQRSGPVDGTMTDTGVKVSDPSDPFEQAAVANSERVVSRDAAAPATAGAGAADGAVGVQRHGDDDAEAVQGMFIQREGDEEAEEVQGLFVQREGEEEEIQESVDEGASVQRAGEEDELEEG
jgi:hypothetical protein